MSSVNWWCFGCRRWGGYQVWVGGGWLALTMEISRPRHCDNDATSSEDQHREYSHADTPGHRHIFITANFAGRIYNKRNFRCLLSYGVTELPLLTSRLKTRLQWSWWQRLPLTRFLCLLSNEAGSWCECCVPVPDNSHLTLTFHLLSSRQ